MPISIVTSRNNTIDSLLVLVILIALLVAPGVWAAIPIGQGNNQMSPLAGPAATPTILTVIVQSFLPQYASANAALVHYLLANQGQSGYLLATVNAQAAAPFILGTDRPAIALGGFTGFALIDRFVFRQRHPIPWRGPAHFSGHYRRIPGTHL